MAEDSDARRRKGAVEQAEPAAAGAAVRAAFLRHIDEQQQWAGFVPMPEREAAAMDRKPAGRGKG